MAAMNSKTPRPTPLEVAARRTLNEMLKRVMRNAVFEAELRLKDALEAQRRVRR